MVTRCAYFFLSTVYSALWCKAVILCRFYGCDRSFFMAPHQNMRSKPKYRAQRIRSLHNLSGFSVSTLQHFGPVAMPGHCQKVACFFPFVRIFRWAFIMVFVECKSFNIFTIGMWNKWNWNWPSSVLAPHAIHMQNGCVQWWCGWRCCFYCS